MAKIDSARDAIADVDELPAWTESIDTGAADLTPLAARMIAPKPERDDIEIDATGQIRVKKLLVDVRAVRANIDSELAVKPDASVGTSRRFARSMTTIRSALSIVDSRWAMTRVVRSAVIAEMAA